MGSLTGICGMANGLKHGSLYIAVEVLDKSIDYIYCLFIYEFIVYTGTRLIKCY